MDKNREREPEIQGEKAEHKVVPRGWAELAAGVKARAEAPPLPTVEAVVEEVVSEKEEPQKLEASEEERGLHERMIEAGRHMRERGKERVWGIDRKIYHRIVVAVDKRADKHLDRSVGDNKKHHRRRLAIDRRVRRGARFIAGVHPFRPIPSWRH